MSKNKEDYEAAAKKLPKNRSVDEQALVDAGKNAGMLSVKNYDFEAREAERRGA